MTNEVALPEPVSRRGITEAQWRTAMGSLFPGAKAESVLMVFDYCKARQLDPLKKPCHIVPIQVKTGDGYVTRDVVMPGIYEYRTTAHRTGEYMGHSEPQYGPIEEYMGVQAPAWCSMIIYRWNDRAKIRVEFPVRVKFSEIVATRWDNKAQQNVVNARWTKASEQMLTKCTEAAGLREAFPDELGGMQTEEEMFGQQHPDYEHEPITRTKAQIDTSAVVDKKVDEHVAAIKGMLANDEDLYKDEFEIAKALRDYEAEYLTPFPDMYQAVFNDLASAKIITKGKFREYLKLLPPEEREPRVHGA